MVSVSQRRMRLSDAVRDYGEAERYLEMGSPNIEVHG
jgi:hypothetical protein